MQLHSLFHELNVDRHLYGKCSCRLPTRAPLRQPTSRTACRSDQSADWRRVAGRQRPTVCQGSCLAAAGHRSHPHQLTAEEFERSGAHMTDDKRSVLSQLNDRITQLGVVCCVGATLLPLTRTVRAGVFRKSVAAALLDGAVQRRRASATVRLACLCARLAERSAQRRIRGRSAQRRRETPSVPLWLRGRGCFLTTHAQGWACWRSCWRRDTSWPPPSATRTGRSPRPSAWPAIRPKVFAVARA